LSRIITRILPLVLLCHVFSGHAGAQQSNRSPGLALGDAVMTGFSETIAMDPTRSRPANKSAVDLTFINPDGPSARVVGIGRPGYIWDGRLFPAPKKFDVFAKDTGQLFGVALDDQPAPNIYLAATSAFGLHLVGRGADGLPERRKVGGPGTGWMKGQFGLDLQGDPGSIYKVDGTTGAVSLFAKVMLDGVPNPGPALGNLAYDAGHKQLFVSDLYTGMIHRFAVTDGSEPGAPYDHGVTGRGAAGMAPVPFNPANRPNIANNRFNAENPDSWGFAPPERRVWGVAVSAGRLFYSARNGGDAEAPQIWSVGIAQDGSFNADARLELELAAQPGPYPVSDIAFSQKGAMILAQRAPIAGSYDYSALTRPGEPRVLRYLPKDAGDPPSPGLWKPTPEEYAIGFAGTYRNTDGGVALGYGYGTDGTLSGTGCEAALWTTGQNLRNNPALRGQLEPGGPLLVNGLQGSPADMVRGANEPPTISYFIDYDDKFDDARASGHIGSVRILAQPCTAGAVADTVPPPNSGTPALTTNVSSCVGPDCPKVCTPTCVCPPGTVLEGRECTRKICSPGTILRNGECVRVETIAACIPPMISDPKTGSCVCPPGVACVCPPGSTMQNGTCVPLQHECRPPLVPGPTPGSCVCPPGTAQQGRTCVAQICPSPLVPGPCECPRGSVEKDGLCVPAPKCPLPLVLNADGICACPAPMVPGARPDTCVCPHGTVLVDGKCVPPPKCPSPLVLNADGKCVCPPPMLSGAKPDTCICPEGTVLEGGKCIKKPPPPKCLPPQIPNVDGICMCPPPMLPGPKPGICRCPAGTELKGGQCVKVESCGPRQLLNAAGICITPEPKRKPEKRQRKRERDDRQEQEPRRPQRIDLDGIPGIGIGGGRRGGGFGGGGEQGGGGGGRR
jgi:hypothetical protein